MDIMFVLEETCPQKHILVAQECIPKDRSDVMQSSKILIKDSKQILYTNYIPRKFPNQAALDLSLGFYIQLIQKLDHAVGS